MDWQHVAELVMTGIGVYGAIRADLARAIVKAESAEKAADGAHTRISGHINDHAKGAL